MSFKIQKKILLSAIDTIIIFRCVAHLYSRIEISNKNKKIPLKPKAYFYNICKCLFFIVIILACTNKGNSQVSNFGNVYIPSGGNVAITGDYSNTLTAVHQNNGNLYLSGNFTNDEANMPYGTGSTNFIGISLQKILGTQPSYFYNALLSNASNMQLSKDVYIKNIYTPKTGCILINGNTLNLSGTIDNNASNNGTMSGSLTSNLYITGSGNLGGPLNFASGARQLNNFTVNRTSGGIVTLATDVDIYGVSAMTNGALVINGNTLGLYGTVSGSGSGTLTGSSTSSITIGGSSGGNLGTLYFTPGAQLLKRITLNRSGSLGRVVMGTNLDLLNITLTKGVLVTNTNLITFTNAGGTLTGPANSIPWTAGSGNKYTDSYIATCDATGNPLTVAWPYSGNYGFRINNVSNTDTYFPVAESYNSSPNRLMLNNKYTSQSFTVVVTPGDIANTAGPRINRIWYIKAALDTASVNMRLFFTERNTFQYSSGQDEIETGFDYSNIILVQKDYTSNPNFISKAGGTDIKSFMYGTYANTEVYAQYTIGISASSNGSKNGITAFNRFAVVNPLNIILPVTVTNLKASLQNEKVKLDWTSVNELNIADYTIERSANATNFIALGSLRALNNGQPRIDYSFNDLLPLNGNNYYRLRVNSKDGNTSYTNIVRVNFNNTTQPTFFVYPNPVTSKQFTLLMNNLPSGKYTMQIFNAAGQQVMNSEINNPGNSFTQTIRLTNDIKPGAYILQLINGDKKLTQTLIVE